MKEVVMSFPGFGEEFDAKRRGYAAQVLAAQHMGAEIVPVAINWGSSLKACRKTQATAVRDVIATNGPDVKIHAYAHSLGASGLLGAIAEHLTTEERLRFDTIHLLSPSASFKEDFKRFDDKFKAMMQEEIGRNKEMLQWSFKDMLAKLVGFSATITVRYGEDELEPLMYRANQIAEWANATPIVIPATWHNIDSGVYPETISRAFL